MVMFHFHYKLHDLYDLPVCDFFMLVEMAADSSTRFGIGGVLTALFGNDKKESPSTEGMTDFQKLKSIGIGI